MDHLHQYKDYVSTLIEKLLTLLVSFLKTYVKDNRDFLRKLPSEFYHSCALLNCDIESLYTSIPKSLGFEAVSYWVQKKRDFIPARFTKEVILETNN